MGMMDDLILKRVSKRDIFTAGDLNRSMAQLGFPKEKRSRKRYELVKSGRIRKTKGGWYECLE